MVDRGKKLGDVVSQTAPEDIPPHLERLGAQIRQYLVSATKAHPRTDELVTFTNLGRETALQLERLAANYPDSIEAVAWCTRSLFEINLVVRYIVLSESNCRQWIGQIPGDETQMLEGFISLSSDKNSPEVVVMRDRLGEIDEICRRHGFDSAKPFRMDKIAAATGRSDEYQGLYKLFSKFVHPSAWLVNSPDDKRQSPQYLNIFLIHAQLYGGDTYGRLREWFQQHGFLE
jgi:hypothetical protein